MFATLEIFLDNFKVLAMSSSRPLINCFAEYRCPPFLANTLAFEIDNEAGFKTFFNKVSVKFKKFSVVYPKILIHCGV